MNIAELFVNLGIKGSDKTLGAISNVKKGMGETASMSLEAKAAIIGAIYAFQRLMSVSGQRGTELSNFNATIGMSAKLLQQYQHAARQVGVSNEEMAGTFKSLQSNMSKTLMGKGAPEGMTEVARLTGELTPKDIERFMRNPELLLQRLQDYADKEKNIGRRNEVLKSFGIGDNMIAALSKQAFTPDVLNAAPVYSDSEVNRLNQANVAWANLGNTIEMAFGRFNAEHGTQLVQDITKITEAVLDLSDALTKLSNNLGFFDVLSQSLQGMANTIKLINEFIDLGKGGETEEGDLLHTDPETLYRTKNSPLMKFLRGDFSEALKHSKEGEDYISPDGRDVGGNLVAPPQAPALPSQSSNKTQNFNINQNLNFQHEGKDAKQTGDSMKVAVQQAYRQSFGLVQVS